MKLSFFLSALAFVLLFSAAAFSEGTNGDKNRNVTVTTNVVSTSSTVMIEVVTNIYSNVTLADIQNKYFNYIGFYAGASTGQGIAYRYFDDWGIQVSFIPYIISDTAYFCVGLMGMKTIYDADWMKFFFYLGGSYQYIQDRTYTYNFYGSSSSSVITNNYFNLGMGPGIEFHFEHFAFDLMLGYAIYQFNMRLQAMFTAECGIFFKF